MTTAPVRKFENARPVTSVYRYGPNRRRCAAWPHNARKLEKVPPQEVGRPPDDGRRIDGSITPAGFFASIYYSNGGTEQKRWRSYANDLD